MKDKFNMVGETIPEFILPNSHGETTNIKDLRGQNVIVILFRNIN